MPSKPGYPTSLGHNQSYPNRFTDSSGNVYNGQNGGYLETFWRDKTGNNTPGWPHVKQENFYMTVSSTVHDGPINYRFEQPGVGVADGSDSSLTKTVGGGGASSVLELTWPIIVRLYSQAQAKAYNNLMNLVKNQKVNYAQAYAERAQVSNLVASTARRLAESFMALRRGNIVHAAVSLTGSPKLPRGVRRVAGGIPEQWLALQYGWKPLLSDVYGSAEELAKYHAGVSSPPFAGVEASGRATEQSSIFVSGNALNGNPDWICKYSASARGRAYVDWWLRNDVSQTAARTGLTNPLNLAWELLPYSFVVDWFLPVGQYLNNLDYATGLDFHRGWESMKIEVAWNGTPTNTNRQPPGFSSGGWSGGSWSGNVQYYQRLPVGSFPLPPLPHLKDPFSPTHVANGLSLLATAFSSTSRVR